MEHLGKCNGHMKMSKKCLPKVFPPNALTYLDRSLHNWDFRQFKFYEILIVLLRFCFLRLFPTTFCDLIQNNEFRVIIEKFDFFSKCSKAARKVQEGPYEAS